MSLYLKIFLYFATVSTLVLHLILSLIRLLLHKRNICYYLLWHNFSGFKLLILLSDSLLNIVLLSDYFHYYIITFRLLLYYFPTFTYLLGFIADTTYFQRAFHRYWNISGKFSIYYAWSNNHEAFIVAKSTRILK